MRPNLTPEDIDHVTLIKQLEDVRHKENAVFHIVPKIKDLSASSEEVLEWYFAKDPYIDIQEILISNIDPEDDPEALDIILDEMLGEPDALIVGGAILLGSRLMPDIFEQEDPDVRRKMLQEKHREYRRLGMLKSPNDISDRQALILTVATAFSEVYSVEERDAEAIYIAAEMLENGSSAKNGFKRYLKNSSNEEALIQITQQLSTRLYNTVATMSTIRPEEQELSDGVRMLGLNAAVQIASRNMGASMDKLKMSDYTKADLEFSNLVNCIFETVFNRETGINERLNSNVVKGPIHEAIWFLDAYVLRRMYPEKYGPIRMNPSYLRDDAPEINYPDLNRGYDFVISNGVAEDYVQLKSRSSQQEYHPSITVLEEKNFQDIQSNGKRLFNKLRAYMDWYINDFDPAMNPRIEKFILPSVVEEMEEMLTLTETRRSIISKILGRYIKIQAVDAAPTEPTAPRRHKLLRHLDS